MRAAKALIATLLIACAPRTVAAPVPKPQIIPHDAWQATPPLGYVADATRRNKAPGDSLKFHNFTITVLQTTIDSSASKPFDVVRLKLDNENVTEERIAKEGSAFNWNGFHIAIVAVYGAGELGGGLAAIEVGTIASLPKQIAESDTAGGAAMRLRIRHKITHITLHHEGDAQPLKLDDDVVKKLRGLQAWGASDRNWWDVPYHFLIDLRGNIYEGRDYHFMGETNTTYDPSGHFLITAIGNYDKQEPTQAQLNAIADLMAWAVSEFDVPLDNIKGHYNYADTDCPGKNLRKYLEDGTFRRLVQERLGRKRPGHSPNGQ
ncbi:MAG TPA: N-acetylmuramoyl-L-alanine amidase [Gemmatimonadaceae bacterium]|nr:N-acetylmuramoyl-L-alanine amidase [Gemmatimonadaceae bacterium]